MYQERVTARGPLSARVCACKMAATHRVRGRMRQRLMALRGGRQV